MVAKIANKRRKEMKRLMVAVILMVVMLFASNVYAQNWLGDKVILAFPMETGAVGFWFPADDSFAVGVSHTVLRVSYADFQKVSLDFDGTIAQEISEENDNTLAGIGIKLNFHVKPQAEGITFLPSLGVTALNDFSEFSDFGDIIDNYDIAVYGTLLMYKW
jgi:hypothetical protein